MSEKHENNHKIPTIHFEQYLNNYHEPRDVITRDTPEEHEAELLENSIYLKRRFRNMAYRLRTS